jgi:hypothetical protein
MTFGDIKKFYDSKDERWWIDYLFQLQTSLDKFWLNLLNDNTKSTFLIDSTYKAQWKFEQIKADIYHVIENNKNGISNHLDDYKHIQFCIHLFQCIPYHIQNNINLVY